MRRGDGICPNIVARIERRRNAERADPDFASLNPGYGMCKHVEFDAAPWLYRSAGEAACLGWKQTGSASIMSYPGTAPRSYCCMRWGERLRAGMACFPR